MIASIPWLQSALNFFTNGILICQGCSKILELHHPFKICFSNLHFAILSCTLVTRHDHVLRFLSIYFYTNLLTSDYKSFDIFFTVHTLPRDITNGLKRFASSVIFFIKIIIIKYKYRSTVTVFVIYFARLWLQMTRCSTEFHGTYLREYTGIKFNSLKSRFIQQALLFFTWFTIPPYKAQLDNWRPSQVHAGECRLSILS